LPAFAALVFVSASSLSYELILMRLFSIVQWYHLAYMVISIALLGFAASGTVLALVQSRRMEPFTEKDSAPLFSLISFFLFIFTVASFYLAHNIPFSPFQLVWQKRQYAFLAGYYVLFFVPFFLAGCFIGLNFMCFRGKIARVYFYNLLGSGSGVAIAFLSFYVVPPEFLLIVCSFLAFLGFLLSAAKRIGTKFHLLLTVSGILFLSFCLITGGIPLQISPYKGISKSLQLPGSKIEYEEYSPLGLVQVVDAPSLRYAPGLSIAYTQGPPPQKEIFVDGNSHGAVTNFSSNKDNLEFLDYSTFSLAYHVTSPQRVLILNPGGTTETLAALYHSADHIQVVETYPGIVRLLKGPLKSFSQSLYDQHPHVGVDIGSPREFMARDPGKYDLIQLGLIGSWGGVGGGIYATGENYIYTREAFQEYFDHLKSQGIFSASAWLSSPPRTFLKLLALAVETLEENTRAEVPFSIVAIRSWATGTVLIKKGRFSALDISKVKAFSRERAFDLIFYAGIDRNEVNHFTVLENPLYYETICQLLHRDKRHELYARYVFHIQPPTDDKPYFFHFFRLAALAYLLKTLGREWIPFLEWGYVILWATLAQALVLAPLFIILPLVFIGSKQRQSSLRKGNIVLYFSLLGLAFMFIEMGYIQKFIVVLSYPIFALALVLFTLLFFSGIGSLMSAKIGESNKWLPFIGILLFSCVSLFFLDGLLKFLLPYPLFIKCISAVILLAPLAFFMGMPFPIGLQLVSNSQSNYIPWVWGINGVASVIAPVLGSLLSISLGFHTVVALSMVLYCLAGWVIHFLVRPH
jgi:spermidine synthase